MAPDLIIFSSPSPSINPASHWGEICLGNSISGLKTGAIAGKASFNTSGNPQFNPPLILTKFEI